MGQPLDKILTLMSQKGVGQQRVQDLQCCCGVAMTDRIQSKFLKVTGDPAPVEEFPNQGIPNVEPSPDLGHFLVHGTEAGEKTPVEVWSYRLA